MQNLLRKIRNGNVILRSITTILSDKHSLSVTRNRTKKYPIGSMEWNEVKTIIETNRLELLGRNDEQQAMYDDFRNSISKTWLDVTNYLYVTKFNFDSSINDDNKMIAIRPERLDLDKKYTYPNDFPYNFSSKIKHYVLWKLSTMTIEEVNEKAIMLMKELNADDYVTYINPVALKSIEDIEHGHILIYKK